MKKMKLQGLTALILFAFCAAGAAHAQNWWDQNMPKMQMKERGCAWANRDGDQLNDILETLYGLPDKSTHPNTHAAVGEAMIKFHNAMVASGKADEFDNPANLPCPRPDGECVYYVPSPDAITALLDPSADPAKVFRDEYSNSENRVCLKNSSEGSGMMHLWSPGNEPDGQYALGSGSTGEPGDPTEVTMLGETSDKVSGPTLSQEDSKKVKEIQKVNTQEDLLGLLAQARAERRKNVDLSWTGHGPETGLNASIVLGFSGGGISH